MPQQLVDRMAVHVDGDGDALVMVHGLGGTSNVWTPLMPVLGRQRVIRPELPGSGRSHRAHALEAGPLSIDRLVAAVLRVCSAMAVERAWFAGHSLGTIVCMHLAAREPALVRGLALFGALLAPPDPARGGLRQRAAKARSEGMSEITDTIVQGTLSSHTRETQPVAVAAIRESLMGQCPEGYARTCEALADAQPADVSRIQAPALLVTGADDAIAPAQGVRAIAAKMPNARAEVLPRCGHWTTYERPAECAALLRDFIARGR
jgi:pimeloyl-ACP methyl ester carboxylesterase